MSTYQTSQQERTERASREAAQWLDIMRAQPGAEERKAFAAWIESAPLHVREMLIMGMLDEAVSNTKLLERFDLDAVVAAATAGNKDNVVSLHAGSRQAEHAAHAAHAGRGRRSRRRPARWLRIAGVAAVLLLGVAGWGGMHQFTDSGVRYATAIGEQRSIELKDGTHVTMAPDSVIRVNLSSDLRSVKLRKGEARFDVIHDPSRPFRVYGGTAMIEDVGTVFSVNRLPSGTIVSVMRGHVTVTAGHLAALNSGIDSWVESWLPGGDAALKRPGVTVEPLRKPLDLTAGDVAHVSRSGNAVTRGSVAKEREKTAQAPRLVFHDDTLADIATEFNRYNATQIVVEGDAARLTRFSGVFAANDASSFLQFLDCCSHRKVARDGNRVVIR